MGGLFEILEEHPNFVVFKNIEGTAILYEKVTNTVERLDSGFDSGLFSRLRHVQRKNYFRIDQEAITNALSRGFEKLTLETTDECNLRCRGCIYGGTYLGERVHAHSKMSSSTARKALEIFSRQHAASPHINYWGGESFLNIDLIDAINDVGTALIQNVSFHATSNMILARRFAKNITIDNFYLTASLNGPKSINDKVRVNQNGEGTYDAIIDALKFFELNYPNFYKNIILSVVLTDIDKLDVIREFFATRFSNQCLKISFLQQANLASSEFRYSEESRVKYNEKLYDLAKEYVSMMKRGVEIDNFLHSLFDALVHNVSTRIIGPVGEHIFPVGTCIPLAHEMYVDVTGQIWPCSETAGKFPLGNINDGINLDAQFKGINDYVDIRNGYCTDCWAVRICQNCYAHTKDEEGKMSMSGIANHCDLSKKSALVGLSLSSAIYDDGGR